MGGLGFIVPAFSKNKDAAWEWIKFCCSGDNQDPEIGKAWVRECGPAGARFAAEEIHQHPAVLFRLQESLPVAMRFLPIPESNALYESVGTEVASVVHRPEAPRPWASRTCRRRRRAS